MRLNIHSSNWGEEGKDAVTLLSGNKEAKSYSGKVCYVGVDSQQSVGLREELLLQGDDNNLHVLPRLLPDETGHLDTNKPLKTSIFNCSSTTSFNVHRQV